MSPLAAPLKCFRWDQQSPRTQAANLSILPDLFLGTPKDLIPLAEKWYTVPGTQLWPKPSEVERLGRRGVQGKSLLEKESNQWKVLIFLFNMLG